MTDELPTTWDQWKARRPSDAHRDGYAADLIARAHAHRDGGRGIAGGWGIDDVTGTALVLDDTDLLAAVGQTETSALEVWAGKLWGIDGGHDDAATGLTRTRAWFRAQRDRLAPPHPDR